MLDDKDTKAGTLKETVVSLKESINKAKLDNDVLVREKGDLEELLRKCELKKGTHVEGDEIPLTFCMLLGRISCFRFPY